MKFSLDTKKDLTIFKLLEKRLDTTNHIEFKTEILALVETGMHPYLVIDLAQVDAIDSSGIGALLVAHRQTISHDGFAALIGIRQRVHDLLHMTNLDKQLYIFNSIQEVLNNIETVDEDDNPIPKTRGRKKSTVVVEDEEDTLEGLPELPDDALAGDDLDALPVADDVEVPEFPDDDEDSPKRGKKKGKKPAKAAKGAKAEKEKAPKKAASKAKKK
ncbi:MAG: STAS domain-containing protein [Chloroherpetonaceae bacterium]|nr:STAS domain-containing protein [Chloroherpetonaceae bacterium]